MRASRGRAQADLLGQVPFFSKAFFITIPLAIIVLFLPPNSKSVDIPTGVHQFVAIGSRGARFPSTAMDSYRRNRASYGNPNPGVLGSLGVHAVNITQEFVVGRLTVAVRPVRRNHSGPDFHSPERLRRDLAHVNAFVGARLTLVPLTCSDFLAASRAGLPCLSFGSGYGCQLPGRSPAAHIVLADIPDFGAGQLILWRVCYEVRKTMWRGYGRGTRCLDSEQLCDPACC